MKPTGRPTMRDVAEAAGVSRALVSIVFREAPGASSQTRKLVFAAAKRIGYRTNRTASLLALHRTRHLGVVMDLGSPFQAELVAEIQAAADAARYEIVLGAVTPTHPEERAVETLLGFRCEALMLIGAEMAEQQLRQLAERVPVAVVGRRTDTAGIEVVRNDDDAGLAQVVDHLVALGHRDIAHIDGGRGMIARGRRRGFDQAMRSRGLADCARVLRGGSDDALAQAAVRRLLQRGLPTAIVAFNDQDAVAVMDELGRAGIAVPDQVSVTGYDNSTLSRLSAVSLTSVSQDAAAQARLAVAILIERLDGQRGDDGSDTVVAPRLMVRSTTGPVPPDRGTGTA